MKTDDLEKGCNGTYPGGFVPAASAPALAEILRSMDEETVPPAGELTFLNRRYRNPGSFTAHKKNPSVMKDSIHGYTPGSGREVYTARRFALN